MASYVPGNYGLYCNMCVEFVEEVEVAESEEVTEVNNDPEVDPKENENGNS